MHAPPAGERGMALLLALVLLCLVAALGSALVGLATTERAMAGNQAWSVRARYGADALAERVVLDLASAPDWTGVLSGAPLSSFFDPGAATGTPGLDPVDVAALTSGLQEATEAASIVGADTPVWRFVAAGTVAELTGLSRAGPPVFLAAWVADDAADGDAAPAADANGVVQIRAEAFGSDGLRQGVQITLRKGALYSPETSAEGVTEADATQETGGLAPIVRHETGVSVAPAGAVRVLTWRDVR
jgi:hypothetical protein